MQTLHRFSHCVFNNLSHVAELPWEKYLGEMHEFLAPGTDELQVFSSDQHVPSYWSTLVCVKNLTLWTQTDKCDRASLSIHPTLRKPL